MTEGARMVKYKVSDYEYRFVMEKAEADERGITDWEGLLECLMSDGGLAVDIARLACDGAIPPEPEASLVVGGDGGSIDVTVLLGPPGGQAPAGEAADPPEPPEGEAFDYIRYRFGSIDGMIGAAAALGLEGWAWKAADGYAMCVPLDAPAPAHMALGEMSEESHPVTGCDVLRDREYAERMFRAEDLAALAGSGPGDDDDGREGGDGEDGPA